MADIWLIQWLYMVDIMEDRMADIMADHRVDTWRTKWRMVDIMAVNGYRLTELRYTFSKPWFESVTLKGDDI